MALINCEECNRQISDKAVSCPGCGFPLRLMNKSNIEIESVEAQRKRSANKRVGECPACKWGSASGPYGAYSEIATYYVNEPCSKCGQTFTEKEYDEILEGERAKREEERQQKEKLRQKARNNTKSDWYDDFNKSGKDPAEIMAQNMRASFNRTSNNHEPDPPKSKSTSGGILKSLLKGDDIPWFTAGVMLSQASNAKAKKEKQDKELLRTQQKILAELKKKK